MNVATWPKPRRWVLFFDDILQLKITRKYGIDHQDNFQEAECVTMTIRFALLNG